jgi:hypothetical protein
MNLPITRFGFIFILALFSMPKSVGQISDRQKIKGLPRELTWENKPKSFQISPTYLRIISGEKTDMFRDPNVTYNTDNAPKLLFEADSNFVFTASVEHAFANKWDGGALVIKQDSLNWVKCCFEKDYTGAKRVVSVVTKGISDDCNSVEIKGNKVYFKIAKANNVITLYYSLTGKSWYLFRHFTFDTKGPLKIGFLSQSPTGTECTVTFRDIFYSTIKIKDPYAGE